MRNLWELPRRLSIGGREVEIDPDFRTVLQIFRHFQNEELPEFLRWEVALRLFYREEIPAQQRREAMEQLAQFVSCGRPGKPGPRLLDWEHDAMAIVADVNRVAGREIRELEFVHWWTFLSWFHAIGEGQLSSLVELRRKLARGEKLDDHQRQFYRENKAMVDLPRRHSASEQAEIDRLNALLNDPGRACRGGDSLFVGDQRSPLRD